MNIQSDTYNYDHRANRRNPKLLDIYQHSSSSRLNYQFSSKEMKLSKRLLNLLYQIIVNEMERSKGRPEGYNKDLLELEKIIFKEYEKQRDY